ncbi:MAG: flavin reductase family protein [Aquificaceae bacterium]|nr:flavin reductase family protein [Aquificaceae bacterium]
MVCLKHTSHALPPPDGVLAPQENLKVLEGAYFLGYVPRTVAIVCVEENPLAVAWHMPTNKEPFLYAVCIAKDNYSHSLIEKHADFTINFLSAEYLSDILVAGNYHGDKVNKWELFKKLRPAKALRVNALVVEESLLVYECKQERTINFPDHTLLIGRVELIHYKRGKLKPDKVSYPLHMGKGYFSKNSKPRSFSSVENSKIPSGE